MRKDAKKMKLKYDLQFFAEGASGGAGGASGASASGVSATGTTASPVGANAAPTSAGNDQPKFDVDAELHKQRVKAFGKERADKMSNTAKKGVTTPAAEESKVASNTAEQSPDPEARKKSFNDYFEQNKDLFTEKHNETFNKRYKELNDKISSEKIRADESTAQYEVAKPVLDFMFQKHGVNNVQDLMKAIEEDDSYWEDGAREHGMTVEAFKKYSKTLRELDKAKQAEQIKKTDEHQRQQFEGWIQQGNALKATVPTFDLLGEIKASPQFHTLLKSGIPLETAYNTVHFNEIVTAREEAAKVAAREAYVASLQGKQARPAENALGRASVGKLVNTVDMENSTAQQRAEWAEQSKRGIPIRFK